MTNAPRTGTEAVAWLKAQQKSGTTAWHGLCLSLARHARGIPALYPSALAAAHGTPKSERILYVSQLRTGHVVYFDDPNDGNPYGHIATVAGWVGPHTDSNNCIVGSSDVVAGKPGAVGFVPITWFHKHWGDRFMFGAGWLNGYNFHDLDAKPTATAGRWELAANLDHAIADLEKAIRQQRALGHTAVVNALWADLSRLRTDRKNLV